MSSRRRKVKMYSKLLIICAVFGFAVSEPAAAKLKCNLPPKLVKEIQSYKPIVNKIISAAVNGEFSGKVYKDVADFTDTFGNRIAGSQNLENAIDNAVQRLVSAGLQVHTEPVVVPNWVRGEEYARLESPRKQPLTILGLGQQPGTGPAEIKAEVVVVKNFDELKAKARQVRGKIVLFNAEFVTYEQTVIHRSTGPSEASKLGAVAALVRTIGPFSIRSPHTGTTEFEEGVTPIPAAAVSLEDADLIARFAELGKKVVVTLKLDETIGKDKISRNVIGDLPGKSKPLHYVTLSGHIDSWDVGQGVMDDAGGAFLSWHSVALIKALNLPPTKRTIRAILWTAEEEGLYGANSYLNNHRDELENWSLALESDLGVFRALGLIFAGNNDAACILQEITSLFTRINATRVQVAETAGSDIGVFQDVGVPIGEALMVENFYFWFHHSNGDTLRTVKSEDLDQNMALFAATAYILADLSVQLPRGNERIIDLFGTT